MDVLSTNVATTRVGGCVYARTCFFCVTKQRIHVVTPTVGSFVFFVRVCPRIEFKKLAFTATKKLKNDGTTFVFHRAFREREMLVFFFPARKGSLSLSLPAHISPHTN
jgi:hypothetical protein